MTAPYDWIRPVFEGKLKSSQLTTAHDLDECEKILDSRLPAGYRAFAQQFGLGGRLHDLPELVPLTRAAGARAGGWWSSVVDATRFWRSPPDAPDLDESFLSRVVVFAIDEGEHTFVFDTGEITKAAPLEYRVYDLPRHDDEPIPIADSFEHWLKWIDRRYRPKDGSKEGAMPYRRISK